MKIPAGVDEEFSMFFMYGEGNLIFPKHLISLTVYCSVHILCCSHTFNMSCVLWSPILFPHKIRVISKLPNTEQSSKGKGKTHKSTTGKVGKPQWPWLSTGISKEMVDFTVPNLPLPFKAFGCHYSSIFN